MITFKGNEEKAELTEASIGVVGHVDHGKTTLVQALTGRWASVYSEELKRGITIRLGYADARFYYCKKDRSYCPAGKCITCMGDAEFRRAVSFVDAPGHETLMATVLSGASLMDGALLIIAANEKCPQPQTAEHLKAIEIAGIEKIVVVQNKIDSVGEKKAKEHYNEIRDFVKGTAAENAPVIPVSALHNVNIDALIEAIEETITTPERDTKASPVFFIARSFDVNKPGTPASRLKGGVIGGSLSQGVIEKGDEIEILPGLNEGGKFRKLAARVAGIIQAGAQQERAQPGGLVALETTLDPSLTRGDMLAGNTAGLRGKMTECQSHVKFLPHLFDHIIGISGRAEVGPVKTGDPLLVTHAVEKSIGTVISGTKNSAEMTLKIPLCVKNGDKIAISRQHGGRWHLIGWGEIQE